MVTAAIGIDIKHMEEVIVGTISVVLVFDADTGLLKEVCDENGAPGHEANGDPEKDVRIVTVRAPNKREKDLDAKDGKPDGCSGCASVTVNNKTYCFC